jgi:hypothetical protein
MKIIHTKTNNVNKKEKGRWKRRGGKVHIHAFIPEGMYQALKKQAEPGEDRWESMTVRRALREWLAGKGVTWDAGR